MFRSIRRWFGRGPIRQTPTILQMEAVECGAAALAMVLAYYGAWIPLERLRIACGVSRDGSKASNIVKAALKLGLAAKGFRKEVSTLSELPMPCIIHWNFNHFVVLEGIDGDRVSINDPSVGRRLVDIAELDRCFTGVALAMEPTEAFRKIGSKPKGFQLLLRELRRSRGPLALVIAVSLALIVPGIVIPGFSKIFVDEILIQNNESWLKPLLIGMAATAVVRALIAGLQQSLLLRLQNKLAVVMISRFLAHVISLPMDFFAQRHAGDIATRVATNEQISRLLSEGVVTNALSLVSVVFFGVAMAAYDLLLTAIVVCSAIVNLVALQFIGQRREDISSSLAMERGKLVASTIGAVRTN
jgi:ABC-type bacteriocin/lantibiotic exporter with double-glycine peptidase domain